MNPDYDPGRLDSLLQLLFDEALTGSDIDELNSILSGSGDARIHYRKSLRLHAALIRHRQVENAIPTRRHPFWPIAAGIAAAISLLAAVVISRSPVATLSGTTTAAVRAGGVTPGLLDQPIDLVAGFVEITYRSGVRVILEGPCQFEVTSATSINVAHGRATVKIPKPVHGLHLDTPAGRITDLGTEFGVAVGSGVEGPVILTEVFDGEIEIPAESTPRKRLRVGDSLAIVRETSGTKLVSTLGDYRVDLGDSARQLPVGSGTSPVSGNLALGKPVTSPSHYSKTHGNTFPPSSCYR